MWFGVILLSSCAIANAGIHKKLINFGGFVCPKEEKALGRCLKDVLNSYIPQLATGLPEYNIPSCEPLIIPEMTVEQSSGAIQVVSTYSDVKVNGPSSMKVNSVEVNSKSHKIVASLHIPELKTLGKYNMTGRMLMLPIEGDGKFSSKYGDIDAIVTIKLGRKERKNAEDALSCDDLHVKFHIGKASVHMDNLFGGDNDLGAAMNKFLNKNWETLADELQQPMENALRDFLKPIADHAFATLNADDILSD